jgi:hypothetical protein
MHNPLLTLTHGPLQGAEAMDTGAALQHMKPRFHVADVSLAKHRYPELTNMKFGDIPDDAPEQMLMHSMETSISTLRETDGCPVRLTSTERHALSADQKCNREAMQNKYSNMRCHEKTHLLKVYKRRTFDENVAARRPSATTAAGNGVHKRKAEELTIESTVTSITYANVPKNAPEQQCVLDAETSIKAMRLAHGCPTKLSLIEKRGLTVDEKCKRDKLLQKYRKVRLAATKKAAKAYALRQLSDQAKPMTECEAVCALLARAS